MITVGALPRFGSISYSYLFENVVGVPIDNTAIYLLNNNLQPVPVGEVGELYAAGLNIAAGYVAGRDAHRFVQNPHAVDPGNSSLKYT